MEFLEDVSKMVSYKKAYGRMEQNKDKEEHLNQMETIISAIFKTTRKMAMESFITQMENNKKANGSTINFKVELAK
jgi:hypothetical protein